MIARYFALTLATASASAGAVQNEMYPTAEERAAVDQANARDAPVAALPAATPRSATGKQKKICKSEQLTTSRMPVRVCRTAAEMKEKEAVDLLKLEHSASKSGSQ